MGYFYYLCCKLLNKGIGTLGKFDFVGKRQNSKTSIFCTFNIR
jgi:hypothetical protein